MKIINGLKTISLAGLISFGTVYSVSWVLSHQDSSEKKLQLNAIYNLANNVQSFHETVNKEDLVSEKKDEIVISVIEKQIESEIKKQKRIVSKKIRKDVLEDSVKVSFSSVARKTKTRTKNSNQDLSYYEINNNELEKISAFNFEKISIAKIVFNPFTIEQKNEIKKEEVVEIKNNIGPIEPVVENENNDDIKMYEYSNNESKKEETSLNTQNTFEKKLFSKPLSNTVKNAINRAISAAPVIKKSAPIVKESLNKIKIENEEIDLNSESNVVYDYSQDIKSATARKETTSNFLSTEKIQNISYKLTVKEFNLDTHKVDQSKDFEFVSDFDRSDIKSDYSNGVLLFEYPLTADQNIITGVISKRGFVPTRLDLSLNSHKGLEAPMLEEESFKNFLKNNKLDEDGSYVLTLLNKSIVDTDIDVEYSAKIYLNTDLKIVDDKNEASYTLFTNVKSGNFLIKHLLTNKDIAQKIAHVGEGELFYDDSSIVVGRRETYTLTSKLLMTNKNKELVLDTGSIGYFNSKNPVKKIALNTYEVKAPSIVDGMRKYLEIKNLGIPMFIGSYNNYNLEVPSKDFIGKVFEMANLNTLNERCMVQINLKKQIDDIKIGGKNLAGEMFIQKMFLDAEGNFSEENFELAEKIFISGDMEGVINAKLEYSDGSSEILKTFCSQGSYLVEQL